MTNETKKELILLELDIESFEFDNPSNPGSCAITFRAHKYLSEYPSDFTRRVFAVMPNNTRCILKNSQSKGE